jgi:hypothetical protein
VETVTDSIGLAIFAATLMLEHSKHPRIVSEGATPSDVSLSLNIYLHVLPAKQDQAAEKQDQLWGGRSPQFAAV